MYPATRNQTRRLIPRGRITRTGRKVPSAYLVLRLDTADPDAAGPPHTPRLPAGRTVEIAGG
ncbi:hypothetical protein Psuf_089980 [Phytohabitans suffuscus]|uniref:Uncharacterized protein n=1 Tax=Phytohabitans suffuscus TaxID=624315 RepID=A0A6F8YZT2_9ACTN|nr:hypothetical protein Psuf_089980 [Phytohabitans suffuscus]